ncbi:DUF4262 domain-containing protein [Catellatospora methionotrophica]|uniref:DUF4262 domain-containing protein n=1 Tax=Catellatospora methionotrophica TaxID=121620 RepID=UPI0033C25E07
MTDLMPLVQEYGQLCRLAHMTPAQRGQRFNGLITQTLQAWGIPAIESVRSAGEIDVAFGVDGARFVLEAKWEQNKANTGHLAKLQKRLKQRLSGTYGVFLSMAGYSAEALRDLTQGERLEILLLDRHHFEAMLSGLVSPIELLDKVCDHAAYAGRAYTTLTDILPSQGASGSIAACHDQLTRPDGTVYFARGHGVGKRAEGRIEVVGGGLTGTVKLHLAADEPGAVVARCHTTSPNHDYQVSLGATLADQGTPSHDNSRWADSERLSAATGAVAAVRDPDAAACSVADDGNHHPFEQSGPGTCACLACRNDRRTSDAYLVDAALSHGFQTLAVSTSVPFVYTIGLWHSYRQPEIAMFGLEPTHMNTMIRDYVRRGVNTAWPRTEQHIGGILDGHVVQVRAIHPSWNDALFGTLYRFYRGIIPAVHQLVWPDKNGLWQWEAGASAQCSSDQPSAWLSVDQHPQGGWQLVGKLDPGFPLSISPNHKVLTTRSIKNGLLAASMVLIEGGDIDVLDSRGYKADDFEVAYIGELTQLNPTLMLLDCERNSHKATLAGRRWSYRPASQPDRRSSKRIWDALTR